MTLRDRTSSLGAPPVLEASELTVLYGGMRAVDDVSICVHEGERLGIIGPNGAGKSTLVGAIAGDIRPSAGSILLRGTHLRTGVPWLAARKGILRTRQELGLFSSMTVRENVLCAIESMPRMLRRAQRVSSGEWLDRFGLLPMADAVVRNLPYGTRKLVELARALAAQPDVLLLDEPAAGLNTAEKTDLVRRLDRILAERGIALMLVEHDMTTVSALCAERTIAMVAGRVIASGRFTEVVSDPAVLDAYFGSDSKTTNAGRTPDSVVSARPGRGL